MPGHHVTLNELITQQRFAQKLRLPLSPLSHAVRGGQHALQKKGRGMDFDDLRLYQAGDDARLIDWGVTARTGKTHTKILKEDKERRFLFFADMSHSMRFGTRQHFKSVIACLACAQLAWYVHLQGDAVGGLITSSKRCHKLKPMPGKGQVLQLCHQLYQAHANEPTHNSLSANLQHLVPLCRAGDTLFLFSDFDTLDTEAEKTLAALSKKTTILCIRVHDMIEHQLPKKAQYPFSEGLHTLQYAATSEKARQHYAEKAQIHLKLQTDFFNRHTIFSQFLYTHDNLTQTLHQWVHQFALGRHT